jgi:hypothetical protein
MLEFEGLNYGAIIVAWIATIVIGAYWYSPAGYGKLWSKLTGVDIMKLPKEEANRAITSVAVSSLLQVFALAVILNSLGVSSLAEGVRATWFIWLAFTVLTTVGTTLYQRLSLRYIVLNGSFFLVAMTLSAVILSLWQ